MFVKQKIERRPIKIRYILIGIVLVLLLVELLDMAIADQSALTRSIGSLIIIAICTYFCYQLIYYRLSEFNYKVIRDDVFVERSISKGNHIMLQFKIFDLLSIEPYRNQKMAKRNIFTNSSKRDNWYIISFTAEGEYKRIVIEPSAEILKYLMENAKERENADTV